MKLTKSGDPVIPRIVWQMRAAQHARFAETLFDIAAAARSGLGVVVGMDKSPAACALMDVLADAIARLEAESLHCTEVVEASKELAKRVRAGRPQGVKKVVATNMLAALILGHPYEKRRKPGRPRGSFAGPHPRDVFTKIEALRLANGGTITNAIDRAWSEYAPILGHSSPHQESDVGKKKLRNLYEAGRRLQKVVG